MVQLWLSELMGTALYCMCRPYYHTNLFSPPVEVPSLNPKSSNSQPSGVSMPIYTSPFWTPVTPISVCALITTARPGRTSAKVPSALTSLSRPSTLVGLRTQLTMMSSAGWLRMSLAMLLDAFTSRAHPWHISPGTNPTYMPGIWKIWDGISSKLIRRFLPWRTRMIQ